jgi:hypothetical protein
MVCWSDDSRMTFEVLLSFFLLEHKIKSHSGDEYTCREILPFLSSVNSSRLLSVGHREIFAQCRWEYNNQDLCIIAV